MDQDLEESMRFFEFTFLQASVFVYTPISTIFENLIAFKRKFNLFRGDLF